MTPGAKVIDLAERRAQRDEQCSCGESDVYDGYAECEVHPDSD